jgi:hypothetical protein
VKGWRRSAGLPGLVWLTLTGVDLADLLTGLLGLVWLALTGVDLADLLTAW